MYCPLTYCFDCAPDEYTEGGQSTSATALRVTKSLEQKNMTSLKSYLFFKCSNCKSHKRPQSTQDSDIEEENAPAGGGEEEESCEEEKSSEKNESSEEDESSEEEESSEDEYKCYGITGGKK